MVCDVVFRWVNWVPILLFIFVSYHFAAAHKRSGEKNQYELHQNDKMNTLIVMSNQAPSLRYILYSFYV